MQSSSPLLVRLDVLRVINAVSGSITRMPVSCVPCYLSLLLFGCRSYNPVSWNILLLDVECKELCPA